MRHFKWIGGLALAGLLLLEPRAAAAGAARAMAHWYAAVAPAVFPFLALMPLLTCEAAARAYERLLGRWMNALFDLPGAAAPALVIGMVGGSPAGALAARRLAGEADMRRRELWHAAVAAAGFSPAFLVGSIGAGMLGDAALGWRLAIAQLTAQLALALLLRWAWRGRAQAVRVVAPADGADPARGMSPVRGAVLTVLTIGGYMALFGALAGVAGAYLGGDAANVLLCLLDVPSGARLVAALPVAMETRLVMLSAMCGFGGACVIAQNLGALRGCDMNAMEYVALRVLAAGIGAAAMALQRTLGQWDGLRLIDAVRTRPLAAAGLCAALLSVPALIRLKKSIS